MKTEKTDKVLYRGQLFEPLIANKIANLVGAEIDLQLTDEKANIIDIMNIRNTEIRRVLSEQVDLEAELMTHGKLIDKKVVRKKYNFYELYKETKKDYVPELTIRTEKIDDNYVIVTIKDNGCGLDETTKAKIFDPFFTTKPIGKGTGLGLAITFQIIEKHTGIIDIKSVPNESTTFQITLPIHPNIET